MEVQLSVWKYSLVYGSIANWLWNVYMYMLCIWKYMKVYQGYGMYNRIYED